MWRAHRGQEQHLSSSRSANIFGARRRGNRGARCLRRRRAAWGAPEPSATVRQGPAPSSLTAQGPGSRETCGTARPKGVPAPHPRPQRPGHREWGGGFPVGPSLHPGRPWQRVTSSALILTPRKVPIVHFQSCFKVTLISKLLAALAGDYSCINQGEIMPVTD